MRKTTGLAVLALQCHAFSCGGMLPCPDVGDMKDPERILKVSLESKSDSICSVDFRIVRYRSNLVPLEGMGGGKRIARPTYDSIRGFPSSRTH